MSCPECAGIDRQPIAPGFWECRSEIKNYGYAPVPGATGIPVPLEPHITFRICGNRYQEATSSENAPRALAGFCWCGLIPIAKCTKCDEVMCGDHIRRINGRVVCATHWEEVQQLAAEAE